MPTFERIASVMKEEWEVEAESHGVEKIKHHFAVLLNYSTLLTALSTGDTRQQLLLACEEILGVDEARTMFRDIDGFECRRAALSLRFIIRKGDFSSALAKAFDVVNNINFTALSDDLKPLVRRVQFRFTFLLWQTKLDEEATKRALEASVRDLNHIPERGKSVNTAGSVSESDTQRKRRLKSEQGGKQHNPKRLCGNESGSTIHVTVNEYKLMKVAQNLTGDLLDKFLRVILDEVFDGAQNKRDEVINRPRHHE